MPLIQCPECKAEISDKAISCPNCGFPLSKSQVSDGSLEGIPTSLASDEDSTFHTDSKSKKKHNWIAIIGVCVVVIMLLGCFYVLQGKITADNVQCSQLYNSSLGFGIELGMSKSSIDKVLGQPVMSGSDYLYSGQHLYAKYKDGKLISMYVEYPNDRWITYGGICPGSTFEDVEAKLGEPNSIEHDDLWWYYASRGGAVTGFKKFSNVVTDVDAIYIYNEYLIDIE